MNAKKIIALLLALVLCVGTLAACNSDPQETTQSTTKATEGTPAGTTEGATTPAEPLKNTDIYPISSDYTFTIVTGNANANEADNWNLMVDTIGLDVEWQIVAAEQTPMLFVGNGSEMPDMFMQAAGVNLAKINEYGKGGLLVNYADYLDLMPNLQSWIAAKPKMLDSVINEDGSFYTLPGYAATLTMASNLFYVRTDMTSAAGWDTLPSTVEEFLDMCEDLKNYYKDVDGYVPMTCNGAGSIAYNGAYSNFFFPAFGELMRSDITTNADATKIEVGFATEQFKNYLTFMHELYTKGYMDPDCFINESTTTKAMTNEGLTTMHPHATQLTPDNFASGNMDFQTMPALGSSENGTEARWALPNNYSSRIYMISTTCPDIESAVKFMDAFYATEENPLNEEGTVWGISQWLGEIGVDFVRNDEEGWYIIQEHEGFDTASAWLNVAGTGSAVVTDWNYYENGGTGLMKKALGHRDILSPDGVEIFYTTMLNLTEEEQETYNDVWTGIQNKVTEMNGAFITGQADLEKDWDAYITALYDLGLQDVIDVYQAALDRYNAR